VGERFDGTGESRYGVIGFSEPGDQFLDGDTVALGGVDFSEPTVHVFPPSLVHGSAEEFGISPDSFVHLLLAEVAISIGIHETEDGSFDFTAIDLSVFVCVEVCPDLVNDVMELLVGALDSVSLDISKK